MSEGVQIELLKAKHAKLETALKTEKRKLKPDSNTVADIKKKKLLLKDELVRLDQD